MRKACFEQLYLRAKDNRQIMFIGSDLGHNTLNDFEENIPEQFVMEGISEGHLMGMASGMAQEGRIVFINTIASFINKRGLDQLAMNICRENLDVKIIATGGGLVYGPLGPTHLAIEDLALMSAIPNMKIISPCDKEQCRQAIDLAISTPGPVYIRLAKGNLPDISTSHQLKIDSAVEFLTPSSLTIATTGILIHQALEVAEKLKNIGVKCGVVNFPVIKPIDRESVVSMAEASDQLVVLEEHSPFGGLSSIISSIVMESCSSKPSLLRFGLDDSYPEVYGRQEALLEHFGLDTESIFTKICDYIKEK